MKSIVVTTQCFPPASGGIQNLMQALAQTLAEQTQHSVHVFADGHVFSDGASQERGYDEKHQAAYKIDRTGGLKAIRRYIKTRKILKKLNTDSVSAIFADSWKSIEHLPISLNIPVVVYAHGNEYRGNDKKQKRISKALSSASHIIAVSKDTKERIQPFLPQIKPSISVIHPPVERQQEASEQSKTAAHSLWPAEGIRLLCLCRLVDMKGIDTALYSLASILKSGTQAQLVIAGEGDDQARLQTIVEKLELERHVAFVGRIEGTLKTALYESADLYLQIGRKVREEREAFGITYLEAALSGTPSLCGKAGGAKEAIIQNKTGLIIDASYNPEVNSDASNTIAQNIIALFEDKPRYKAMGEAARRHALAQLWSNQIHAILQCAELEAQ